MDLLRAKSATLVLTAESALELQASINEVDRDLQLSVDAGLPFTSEDVESSRVGTVNVGESAATPTGRLSQNERIMLPDQPQQGSFPGDTGNGRLQPDVQESITRTLPSSSNQ